MDRVYFEEHYGYRLQWWGTPGLGAISKIGKMEMGWRPGVNLSGVTKLEANLMLYAYHLAIKKGFTTIPLGYEWLTDSIPYSWWDSEGSIHKYVWMGYTNRDCGCWYPFHFLSAGDSVARLRAGQLKLIIPTQAPAPKPAPAPAVNLDSILEKMRKIEGYIAEAKQARVETEFKNSSLSYKLGKVKQWMFENEYVIKSPGVCGCDACVTMAKDRYDDLKKIVEG